MGLGHLAGQTAAIKHRTEVSITAGFVRTRLRRTTTSSRDASSFFTFSTISYPTLNRVPNLIDYFTRSKEVEEKRHCLAKSRSNNH